MKGKQMTFTLTRQQLESKRSELATKGVQIVGDSGNFSDKGVSIQYTYAEPTLIVTVLDFGGHAHFIVNHIVSDWFHH